MHPRGSIRLQAPIDLSSSARAAAAAATLWKPFHSELKRYTEGCAAVCVDDRIFVFGGEWGWVCPPVDILYPEHVSSKRRKKEKPLRTNMKAHRARCAAALLKASNKIVVVGGGDATAELYDTETGKWEALPKMRHKRDECAAASVGNKVYVFGGSRKYGNSCEMYDADKNAWEAIPPMPTKRTNCAATAIDDNTILVVGGRDPSWSGTPVNTVEAFHTDTKTWTTLPSMTSARSGCAAASTEGFVFAVGGSNLATFEMLDLEKNEWTALTSQMLVERENCAAVVFEGERLVVMGGHRCLQGSLESVEEHPLGDNIRDLPSMLPKGSPMQYFPDHEARARVMSRARGKGTDGNDSNQPTLAIPSLSSSNRRRSLPEKQTLIAIQAYEAAVSREVCSDEEEESSSRSSRLKLRLDAHPRRKTPPRGAEPPVLGEYPIDTNLTDSHNQHVTRIGPMHELRKVRKWFTTRNCDRSPRSITDA